MITSVVEFCSIVSLGIIAGSTFYSSLVEIPIRAKTDHVSQLANWHLVFPAASGLLKSFGMMTLPLLIAAGVLSSNWLWYVAAAFMFALVPFTATMLAGVNAKLLSIQPEGASVESTKLIGQWSNLHHIRTGMSCLAFAAGAAALTFSSLLN